MRWIDLTTAGTEPITQFESVSAASRLLADGEGEAHLHWVRFEPGGKLGAHPTGFGQLFVVVDGSGWASGADGRRVELRAGQAVFFERGELHAKGSDAGMTALMIQVADLRLADDASPDR